jgi:hypothetical protein
MVSNGNVTVTARALPHVPRSLIFHDRQRSQSRCQHQRQAPPLERLANADLREAKSRLRDALEPLVAGKIRRDRVNAFEARAKAIRRVASELGFDPLPATIHNLSLDQCEQAIRYVEAFIAHRRSVLAHGGA